jgi:glutathione S-transferase
MMRRMCSTGVPLKMYGHFVSQPFRSIAWLLKMHNQPFEFERMDPVRGDTRAPKYTSKFPTALIPGLDDNGFCLAEGSAIAQYLCEKYKWDQWWPSGSDLESMQKRAKISEYLSSHHHTSRMVSAKGFRPFIVAAFKPETRWTAETAKNNEAPVLKIASKFERTFLSQGDYINGMDHPTIADLIAYPEYAQMSQCGLVDYSSLPLLLAWMKRMEALPEHDDVHRALGKLAALGGLVQK